MSASTLLSPHDLYRRLLRWLACSGYGPARLRLRQGTCRGVIDCPALYFALRHTPWYDDPRHPLWSFADLLASAGCHCECRMGRVLFRRRRTRALAPLATDGPAF
jgi:hypothetical protein